MSVLRRVPDWLTGTTYAHRGLHTATVPENSLAAAEGAIAGGFGIECDVQMSGDGTAHVFHDWELDRLTQMRGLIGEWSDSLIAEARLLGTKQRVPTLTRFLEAVGARVPILIEIKSRPGYDIVPSCKAVYADLDRYAGSFGVMSFDPRVPEWFAANAPDICRGLVGTDSLPNGFENVWRHSETLEQAQPDFLAIDRRDLARREVGAWRAAGRPLLSWTIRTTDDRKAAEPLVNALIAEGEALL